MAENESFRHIVRIADTDLDGSKPILHALTKIKGVSFMFANFACYKTNTDKKVRAGELTDAQVKKLDSFITTIRSPAWILNRRNEVETGETKHLISGDIDYQVENDLKRLKMIKSYKGVRHMHGLPVRGQRTKSNFRKNKGKVMGVKRSKAGKK